MADVTLPDLTRDSGDLPKEIKFSLVERFGWTGQVTEDVFHDGFKLVCYVSCQE